MTRAILHTGVRFSGSIARPLFCAPVLLLCAFPPLSAQNLSSPGFPDDKIRDCAASLVPFHGQGCAFADLNGDHVPDMAFSLNTSERRGAATVTIQIAQSGSSQQIVLPRFPGAAGFAFRDVDGDLDLDLVIEDAYHRALGVFWNDGSGYFADDTTADVESDRAPPSSTVQAPLPPCDCSLALSPREDDSEPHRASLLSASPQSASRSFVTLPHLPRLNPASAWLIRAP